jgi:hypothetical protein
LRPDHTVEVLRDITIIAHPLLSQDGELFGSIGLLIRAGQDHRHAQSVTVISAMMLELVLQVDLCRPPIQGQSLPKYMHKSAHFNSGAGFASRFPRDAAFASTSTSVPQKSNVIALIHCLQIEQMRTDPRWQEIENMNRPHSGDRRGDGIVRPL